MTLNDAHIFCTPEQIKEEFSGRRCAWSNGRTAISASRNTATGFRCEAKRIAEKYVGNDEMWDLRRKRAPRGDECARPSLHRSSRRSRVLRTEDWISKLADVMGHQETYSTIQIRFPSAESLRPRVRRRRRRASIAGDDSPRRDQHRWSAWFRYLIELYAGAFPAWLAPVQVAVLPHHRTPKRTTRRSRCRNCSPPAFASHLDERNEKLQAKIRDAQLQKIPYMLVIGGKEAEAGTVAVRHRTKGDLGPRPLDQFLADLKKEIDSPAS